MKSEIIIYTDGACKGNPGVGGWGAILKYKDKNKKIYGYEVNTTNNRMELTATIKALGILKAKSKVVIYTDSKYVMNGITLWIDGWKKNKWRTSSKKGHSGNAGNEAADELANLAIIECGEKI